MAHTDPSRRRASALALAVATALAGGGSCGIRPLTSAELYGAAGAGGLTGSAGAAGPEGTGGTTAAAGARGGAGAGAEGGAGAGGGAAGAGGMAGPAGAGGAAGSATDAAVDTGLSPGCPQVCNPDQFCDELTNQCAARAGAGMLSGTVIDECTNYGTDALVGVAGQHQCSYVGKGSYFFSGLPLGRLKLAAAKEGYDLYGATVEIVPGGVVHDIRLVRIGGCAQPAAPACTCTDASCTRQTP